MAATKEPNIRSTERDPKQNVIAARNEFALYFQVLLFNVLQFQLNRDVKFFVRNLLHVLTEAFLLDLTAHFFRFNHYSTVFDCDCKSSREFNGLFLLRAHGCPKLVFHWSAA